MSRQLFTSALTEGFISVMKDKIVAFITNNLPSVLVSAAATLLAIAIVAMITMNSTQKVHSVYIDELAKNNLSITDIVREIAIQQSVNSDNIGEVVISQKDLTGQLNSLTNQVTALATKSQSDDKYQQLIIESAIQNIKDSIYELKSDGEDFNSEVLEAIQEIEKRLYLLEIKIRELQKVIASQDQQYTSPKLKSLSIKKNTIPLNANDTKE